MTTANRSSAGRITVLTSQNLLPFLSASAWLHPNQRGKDFFQQTSPATDSHHLPSVRYLFMPPLSSNQPSSFQSCNQDQSDGPARPTPQQGREHHEGPERRWQPSQGYTNQNHGRWKGDWGWQLLFPSVWFRMCNYLRTAWFLKVSSGSSLRLLKEVVASVKTAPYS